MKTLFFFLLAILMFLPSCTWVKPTVFGSEVRLFDKETKTFAACEKIGSITTFVKDTFGPFDRSDEKVNNELIILAKNEAAEMGGDTIAAEGPAASGRRDFTVYNCIE